MLSGKPAKAAALCAIDMYSLETDSTSGLQLIWSFTIRVTTLRTSRASAGRHTGGSTYISELINVKKKQRTMANLRHLRNRCSSLCWYSSLIQSVVLLNILCCFNYRILGKKTF
ncbi:hypothetical protein AMECASPLE_002091 [Ameca splendens]|uniref:Uncharacterized protein n=1 Tax=Ameca splendens TaxID=208324 RepID=A0ABV1A6M9_9TELE